MRSLASLTIFNFELFFHFQVCTVYLHLNWTVTSSCTKKENKVILDDKDEIIRIPDRYLKNDDKDEERGMNSVNTSILKKGK